MKSDLARGVAGLPTWRVVALMLASVAGACCCGYLILAVLLGWPGVAWGIGLFAVSGLLTSLLKPGRATSI